jgi:hypothetical protein
MEWLFVFKLQERILCDICFMFLVEVSRLWIHSSNLYAEIRNVEP